MKIKYHFIDIRVDSLTKYIRIWFVPTVPHCTLSTLIGLSIRRKIEEEYLLGAGWKLIIQVAIGTHENEKEINKQLNDKERVNAALENPAIIKIINNVIGNSYY